MRKQILLSAITCMYLMSYSQVDIDKSINLSSGIPADAKITGIKSVSLAQDAVSVEALQKGSFLYAGTSGGSGTAYTVTLTPAISAYTAGLALYFKTHTASGTGPVTINVNGLGAQTIKKSGSTDLASGDLAGGQVVCLIYDGTNFNLSSPINNSLSTVSTNAALTGNGTGSSPLDINATGVGAGTYNNVTVNTRGQVTAGSNAAYPTGTGTTNQVARWSSASALAAGALFDNGASLALGTTTVNNMFQIRSDASNQAIQFNTSSYMGANQWGSRIYKSDIGGGIPLKFDQQFNSTWSSSVDLDHGQTWDHPSLKAYFAIMPSVGNASTKGFYWPANPAGGSGDEAFIRYYVESGENTKMLIGNNNDADDDIGFYQAGAERMTIYNGNVGVGITTPNAKFDVSTGADGIAMGQIHGDNTSTIQSYIDGQWSNRASYAGGCCNALLINPDVGVVGIGTTSVPYKLTVAGDIYANGGWMRVSGNQGLYFESWGGGWYMSDGTWMRAYNDKNIWLGGGLLGANGGLTVGYGGAGSPGGGAIIAGRVNIGSSATPTRAYVEINATVNANAGSYRYLNNSTQGNSSCGGCDYSLFVNNRLWVAGEVNVTSDERTKIVLGKSKGAEDLEKVGKLNVIDYRYKDYIGRGTEEIKGFLAQEVEKIFPNAVAKNTSPIPNIYASASAVCYDEANKTLEVTTEVYHGLQVGDMVQLNDDKGENKNRVTKVFDDCSFEVADWNHATDWAFVYGKEVNDFRNLDYNEIFTAGISAIQELSKQLTDAKNSIEELKAENAQLKKQSETSLLRSQANTDDIAALKTKLEELKTLMEVNGVRTEK